MGDKSELLGQLKIDRSANEADGGVSYVATAAMVVAAAVVGAATMYFLGQTDDLDHSERGPGPTAAVAREPDNASESTTTSPATDPALSRQESARRVLDASGYITARRIATVSSEISGRIVEIRVEEGMIVQQGQVLARLDDAVARVNLQLEQSRVKALQAQVESIEVNLAEAKRVLSRSRELRDRSLVSEATVTSNEASVDALAANLRNAEANIGVSRLQIKRQQELLDDHTVRAPFAGVVTVKNAQMGEIVSPGSAGGGFTRTGICTIVDMDSLEIEVDVNEAFIGRVFPGQKVEANLDAYSDWRIPASVIAIIPTADRAKATVRVRIGIDEKDARILPDMGVKVAFLIE